MGWKCPKCGEYLPGFSAWNHECKEEAVEKVIKPESPLLGKLRLAASELKGASKLAVLEAIEALKSQYESRAEQYFGCMYYFMQNEPPTIAKLRQMNRDGHWWAYAMLNAIAEAGVDFEKRKNAVIRKTIKQGTTDDEQKYITSEFDVIENNELICSISWAGNETDEPKFVVTGWRKIPDWCAEDWGGVFAPWLRPGVYELPDGTKLAVD